MDYRCPVCGTDLGRRRVTQAIVARMEIECAHCKNVIRLNVHRAELVLVLVIFGAIVVFATLGYWLRSQGFVLVAFGAAMLGALAIPLLERVVLRDWPRYTAIDRGTKPPPPA